MVTLFALKSLLLGPPVVWRPGGHSAQRCSIRPAQQYVSHIIPRSARPLAAARCTQPARARPGPRNALATPPPGGDRVTGRESPLISNPTPCLRHHPLPSTP